MTKNVKCSIHEVLGVRRNSENSFIRIDVTRIRILRRSFVHLSLHSISIFKISLILLLLNHVHGVCWRISRTVLFILFIKTYLMVSYSFIQRGRFSSYFDVFPPSGILRIEKVKITNSPTYKRTFHSI